MAILSSDNRISGSPPQNLIWKCALAATFLELLLLTILSWNNHELAHPHSNELDTTQFIEAQVFHPTPQAHLTIEKKVAPVAVSKPEVAISKVPEQGKSSQTSTSPLQEENQTESGPKSPPTHGPIAVYAPSPVIPVYLQNREFKTSVAIDFYVNSHGGVVTKLVGPSGSEELDAIALETVKKWIFRPAETDHQPIDAKVRLRIVFVVK